MAEEGVASSEPASMEDIKELKSSISLMNDSMGELREMMMSFMQANKPPIPPTTTTEVGNPSLDKTSLGAPTEAETKDGEGSAVSEDDRPYIEKPTTSKDAWDILAEVFLGSSSMRQNKFQEVSNKAEGFYMEDGEHHRDMYRRLKALAISFRDLGATYVDDDWIKRKYINALLPFEPADLRILKNKHNFEQMTSNDVMQEMDAFKVESKIAVDSRARAIGMKRSENLALKAHVCVEDDEDLMETKYEGHSEELKHHFIAECPYENREDHGGKLILKDKSKAPRKKPFVKKSGYDICKKPSKYVLIAREEYSSGEEEDDKDDSRSEVAAIAITFTPSSSLFESPNEDSSNNARCLMVKTSHVLTSGDEEDVHEDTLSEKATSASTPMTSLFESPNEDLSFNLNKCLMAKTSEVTT
ncbi:hypothetical protein QYE76_042505 [Lolium multiflorum]|uniref:Uncharacterized protein n=1 Tax=Lolium multiflorum TaxID=4521 RepID=A0AAD8TGY8_LOLMU|nr:hypothetical protein QYE76_042505 [Lolium multiflorum]